MKRQFSLLLNLLIVLVFSACGAVRQHSRLPDPEEAKALLVQLVDVEKRVPGIVVGMISADPQERWVVGVLWLLLAVPLALLFSRFLAEGRGLWTLLPLGLVLLFMLVKALLDFVFRIDFRRNRMARLAYITLKAFALFSLVWIAFRIHASWGTPVLIAFGILAVSLIFTYASPAASPPAASPPAAQ